MEAEGQRERREGMPRVWSSCQWVIRAVDTVQDSDSRTLERCVFQEGRPWPVSIRRRWGPRPIR